MPGASIPPLTTSMLAPLDESRFSAATARERSARPHIDSGDSSEATVPDDPAKVRDAAKQFEALMIAQLLRSVRESGTGWLGGGSSSDSDCATEFAEQQFAQSMAAAGGLGLAGMIVRSLNCPDAGAEPQP